MGAFGGLIITNRGRALQAKAQLGTQLTFTRVGVGDGELGGSSIVDLTALKHEVKSLSLTKMKLLSDGKALIGAILSNQDITTGFYFRELGVFAQDPDIGEILYCYGNAGATAEYIPAGGGPDIVEKNIDIITIVGNASSVNAVIDESLVFETPTGAQEKADIAESNAKAYADQQVAARVLNAGNVPSIQAGLDASKPSPGTAGRLYVATDTQIIYRDTGTAWAKMGVVKWGDIDGKPSSFTPAAHKTTHATGGADALTPADIGAAVASDLTTHTTTKASSTILGHVKQGSGVTVDSNGVISANVTSVAGKTGAVTLTKSDVGLNNVDNMSALQIRTDSTKRLVVEVSSSAPSSPVNGQIWYDSINHRFKGYANGAWV